MSKSSTTIDAEADGDRMIIHPGEILQEELDQLAVTPTELARQLGVPPNRITQILAGKRAITGDTALRLGHWFGTSARMWINLQTQYDLAIAERDHGAAIAALPTRPRSPSALDAR